MIYLDHAATTPLDPRVLRAMLPFLSDDYGNPSSIHSAGRSARVAVERARRQVAALIGADPGDIVFTSGGTEADFTAIWQALSQNARTATMALSPAEHQAVLQAAEWTRRLGAAVHWLPVDAAGRVSPESVNVYGKALTIVSVMHGNNETGAVSDIGALSSITRSIGAAFHSDLVQTAGKMPIDLPSMGIDYAALSAHKIHGPKGVGALYVRRDVQFDALIPGGAQERRRRGGTENVAGIVGFGEAARLALEEREQRSVLWQRLREKLLDILLTGCAGVRINGDTGETLANIVSISFPYEHFGIDGESLLMRLDLDGVCVSSGSACTAGSFEASHVMRAIGYDELTARASVRCSFGAGTTMDDVEKAGEIIVRNVQDMAGRSSDRSHSRIAIP